MKKSWNGGGGGSSVPLPPDEVDRTFPDLPNPRSYAIKPEGLADFFGKDRFLQLKDTPEYQQIKDVQLVEQIPLAMRRFVPPELKLWELFRYEHQMTGSGLAKAMGMHDSEAAKVLDMSRFMYVHGTDPNEVWEEYRLRVKFGKVPAAPLDPPGNFNAECGKMKEAGSIGTLLDEIPPIIYREVGPVVVTEDHLLRLQLVNYLTGSTRITSLPFRLVVNPDGDIEAPAFIRDYNDGEGTPTYGPMEKMALEMKAPIYYFPNDKGEFPGLDYRPGGKSCAPYKQPKPYQMPQVFGEMLALKYDSTLFCSYTLSSGLTAWKIEMDVVYMSLMLTILIYLHDTFIAKDQSVPTNHFHSLHPSHPASVVHARLLQHTLRIIATPPYLKVPGTRTRAFGDRMGYMSTMTFLTFPLLPETTVPGYQLVAIYGRRLLKDFKKIKWFKTWKAIAERRSNLALLANTDLTRYATRGMELAREQVLQKYRPEMHDLALVHNACLKAEEAFVVKMYKCISQLYGSLPFGKTLEISVFKANVVKRLKQLIYEVVEKIWHGASLVIDDATAMLGCVMTNLLTILAGQVPFQDIGNDECYGGDQKERADKPYIWQYGRAVVFIMALEAALEAKNMPIPPMEG